MNKEPAALTLELCRVVPALAEANALKSEDEPMPVACFKLVDRCIDLKGRRYVMLKEPEGPLSKGKFANPGQFWKTAPSPKESFNLFNQVSTIGCSDMENKAAALALVGALLDRQLVCNGLPVLEWGLCKTTITSGLLTIVHKWNLAEPMNTWDAQAQSSTHNFLYFVIRTAPLEPLVTMYYDLSALQFGILDAPHKTSMPIPYVFSDKQSCVDTHPRVYAQAEKWKSIEQIENEYIALGNLLLKGELPLDKDSDVEQRRKILQLLTNFQKFKVALQAVAMEGDREQK